MKKIVYLINLILITASCTIPPLKAVVNDKVKEYLTVVEYLFKQENDGKLFSCYLCNIERLPINLRTPEKQEHNVESQMLVSSECLYCAFHTINNTEEADVLVNNLYKFHTKCFGVIQKNISSAIAAYSGYSTLYCHECWQKKNASQNQNRRGQSNPDNNPNCADCDTDCANLCVLLCMPFSLIAH